MLAVNRQARIVARKKMLRLRLALLFSVGAVVFALIYFGGQLLDSDFLNLAKLAMTDFLSVSVFWRQFLMSLSETLPVVNVVGILLPVFLFLVTLDKYHNFKYYAHKT